jgi:pimeloyl-ACP methyl ester carboxylesterase
MMIRGFFAASFLLSALLTGCTATRAARPSGVVTVGTPRAPAGAVVFCADGAGGFGGTSAALRENLGEGSPVRVELFDWSHGKWRMLSDHLHHRNIVEQGQRLACEAQAQKKAQPDVPIYLVGHSAGSAVVLIAAESVPPGVVDRVVLLAPSVSSVYDLRPALARTRIDAFTSMADWVVLGINMRLSGTTDGRWTTTSGRVGFRQVGNGPCDKALYARLCQHPWDPSQVATGNNGGHYGSFEDGYLRAYVLPLLTPRR